MITKTSLIYWSIIINMNNNAKKDGVPVYYASDRAAWRAWLAEHCATESSVWLIIYRKKSSTPSVYYDEAVDEALCFGWIDSKPNKREQTRRRELLPVSGSSTPSDRLRARSALKIRWLRRRRTFARISTVPKAIHPNAILKKVQYTSPPTQPKLNLKKRRS